MNNQFDPGSLNYEALTIACSNIGYDLTCGSCAELFYTGFRMYECTTDCKSIICRNQPSTEMNE